MTARARPRQSRPGESESIHDRRDQGRRRRQGRLRVAPECRARPARAGDCQRVGDGRGRCRPDIDRRSALPGAQDLAHRSTGAGRAASHRRSGRDPGRRPPGRADGERPRQRHAAPGGRRDGAGGGRPPDRAAGPRGMGRRRHDGGAAARLRHAERPGRRPRAEGRVGCAAPGRPAHGHRRLRIEVAAAGVGAGVRHLVRGGRLRHLLCPAAGQLRGAGPEGAHARRHPGGPGRHLPGHRLAVRRGPGAGGSQSADHPDSRACLHRRLAAAGRVRDADHRRDRPRCAAAST